MNSLRKVLGFLVAAMMLVALALPAAAQTQKLQSISMPSEIGFNRTVTLIWNNATPPGLPGNSQISSARIDIGQDGINAGWSFASAVSSSGTVAVTATSITIQKLGPVKPQKSFTVTFTLNAAGMSCGEFSSFIFTAFTGSSLGGDNFYDQTNQLQPYSVTSATYSCESLACGGGFSDSYLSGTRLDNKDGGACNQATVFTSVNTANRQVSVVSDNPTALFEATVTWPAEFVDSTTGMPKATQVSWQLDGGGNPINFANGRACIGDVPDFNGYGTLTADLGGLATNNTVQTLGVTITRFPTPIVIDSERMNVTSQSGSTLTVTRGAGGATIVPHSRFYSDGVTAKKVMSTPFPLDAFGKVMLVCISAEAFVTSDDCAPVTPSQACVQVTTSVLGDLAIIR